MTIFLAESGNNEDGDNEYMMGNHDMDCMVEYYVSGVCILLVSIVGVSANILSAIVLKTRQIDTNQTLRDLLVLWLWWTLCSWWWLSWCSACHTSPLSTVTLSFLILCLHFTTPEMKRYQGSVNLPYLRPQYYTILDSYLNLCFANILDKLRQIMSQPQLNLTEQHLCLIRKMTLHLILSEL